MHRVALSLAAVSLRRSALGAQQVDDTHSIPAKSKYTLQSFVGKRPLTRAERTNFTETSHYDDVVDVHRLAQDRSARRSRPARSARRSRVASCRTSSRRVRSITTPAEARRLGRPVAYIQANIHAGESRGQRGDAVAAARPARSTKSKNVLDSIVLIVQPIYNADGNEKWGPQERNRGAQNGPELVGTRQNASGWNLNRDYIGADAPETKGALRDARRSGIRICSWISTPPTAACTATRSPTRRRSRRPRSTSFRTRRTRCCRRSASACSIATGSTFRTTATSAARTRARRRWRSAADAAAPPALAAAATAAWSRAGRSAAAAGGGGFGGRGPSLEQMIADSIPQAAGRSRPTSRSRATARTTTACAIASRF